MVNIDHTLGDNQEVMLQKLCLGIGFTPENVNVIVAKALELADEKQISISSEIEKVEKINIAKSSYSK
jgi:hypothetical protein